MNQQEIEFVNSVCERTFNSTNPIERREAELYISTLTTIEGVDKCLLILQFSASPYAQHVAISAIHKASSNFWMNLSAEKQQLIRTQILQFLSNKSQGLAPNVQNALFSLVGRIVKLGWLVEENQSIIQQLIQYTNQSVENCLYGLQLLNCIVSDISGISPSRIIPGTAGNERKILLSFRNVCLLNIFVLSLETLKKVLQNINQQQGNNEQILQLCDASLRLLLSCLSYDFVGTITSDDGEYTGPTQIPSNWKAHIETGNNVVLLFEIYCKISSPITQKALQCLYHLSSVRHSLFSAEKEKKEYLSKFIAQTTIIMRSQIGFNDPQKFHEFCRLLCAMKIHFQVPMFVTSEGYQEWITLVANLTISSFGSWHWNSDNNNSVYFLLNLWSRLVHAMPFLKDEYVTFVDTFVPKITEAYITSRLQSVQYSVQNSEDTYEELMSNEEEILHQLEHLAPLCRLNYSEVGNFLSSRLEQISARYSEVSQQFQANPSEQLIPAIQLCEGELVWILSIISTTIAFQGSASSSQEHETMDGQLAGTVFKFLMSDIYPKHRVARDKEIVDLALLTFFYNFRKKHMGDTNLSSTSNTFKKIKEVSLLNDHLMVYNIIFNRIVANCKVWAKNEEVIRRSLSILSEFCSSYTCSKSLILIEETKYVLQNHSSLELFPFLQEPSFGRQRTSFYLSLTKIILVDDRVMKFSAFVAPLTQTFQRLMSINPNMWDAHAKNSLMGIFRDIRGILQASLTTRAYMAVFDWLHPNFLPIFAKAAETCYSNHLITTPLLKCVEELTHNKVQRISFEPSSPNGILLFRQTSKVLVAYSTGVLSCPVINDVYHERYKGISVCFRIFCHCLQGSYVNFGIFDLYGDSALSDAQRSIINLFLSIPIDELLVYPKLAYATFQMLEGFSRTHSNVLVGMEPSVFVRIIKGLQRGLQSTTMKISSFSATTIDNIVTFCYKQIGKDTPISRHISQHIQQNPDLFPSIITQILNIMIYEEVINNWSLSRPLYTLILLNETYFEQLQQQLISSQPVAKREKYKSVFDGIMTGVERNLEIPNRDKFTQNMNVFLHNIKQLS